MTSYEVAAGAGLCYGVRRALGIAYGLLRDGCGGVLLWGGTIHNRCVIEDMERLGAVVSESRDAIMPGNRVVIRAHGAPPEVFGWIRSAGAQCADATCPHVRRIQELARNAAAAGRAVILAGDRDHPETRGVVAWAHGLAAVVADGAGVESAVSELLRGRKAGVTALAQSTFSKEGWKSVSEAVRRLYPDAEVYDTICGATVERQKAAKALALRADVAIVVGDRASANARRLFELCEAVCQRAYFVETAREMPPRHCLRGMSVGIAAGASTPDWIIEEVKVTMDEIIRDEALAEGTQETAEAAADAQAQAAGAQDGQVAPAPDADEDLDDKKLDGDIDFAQVLEQSIITLQNGDIVKGKIIRFNNAEVFVDLGYKSDGVIPIEDFISDYEQDPAANIQVGEVIDVFVVRVNDGEGSVLLSKKRVDEQNNWSKVEDAYRTKATLRAMVIEVTKGGLLTSCGGVRVFVPASQVSDRYVEDLRIYLKKSVDLKIIDYNEERRKFVGSMKAVIVEEKKRVAEALWNEILPGREYEGVVQSLTAFGAFVDIGGVDGLVHISELSWSRVKHPSDVLKVGEKITVRVLGVDREKKKISLGYRREEDNPWYQFENKYPVGSVVTKRVVRLVQFGAFVELEKGIDGLVHVSQISDTRIAKPDDVLKVGQEVTARITAIDIEHKKISMSIKDVEPIPYRPEPVEGEDGPEGLPTAHVEELKTTFGDILSAAVAQDAQARAADEVTAARGAPEAAIAVAADKEAAGAEAVGAEAADAATAEADAAGVAAAGAEAAEEKQADQDKAGE